MDVMQFDWFHAYCKLNQYCSVWLWETLSVPWWPKCFWRSFSTLTRIIFWLNGHMSTLLTGVSLTFSYCPTGVSSESLNWPRVGFLTIFALLIVAAETVWTNCTSTMLWKSEKHKCINKRQKCTNAKATISNYYCYVFQWLYIFLFILMCISDMWCCWEKFCCVFLWAAIVGGKRTKQRNHFKHHILC